MGSGVQEQAGSLEVEAAGHRVDEDRRPGHGDAPEDAERFFLRGGWLQKRDVPLFCCFAEKTKSQKRTKLTS